MAELPGSAGWPLLSDKSLEFYRDPEKFIERSIEQYQSRIFVSRFLNKTTVFVCSNQGVREVLVDKDGAFKLGYKAYMGEIFGHNILFTEGDEAFMFRDALSHLFTSEAMQSYQDVIKRIAEKHVQRIEASQPLCLYSFFKTVVTEICLTLFLGLDFVDEEVAAEVVSLTLTHWHGIFSVPIKFKIPGTSTESAYCRALEAKDDLLRLIDKQRRTAVNGFAQRLPKYGSEEEDMYMDNHLLLFTSALVPKAISSLLTTLAVEIAKPEKLLLQQELLINEELRSDVFKEVQRMCPPFLGGRRIARKATVIAGYQVPADYAVMYMSGAAHRDPAVFSDPDIFQHERWRNDTSISEDNLFGFGYGPRRCVGQDIVWRIINEVVIQLLSKYNWTLQNEQELEKKLLPVVRPKGSVLANLKPVVIAQEEGSLV